LNELFLKNCLSALFGCHRDAVGEATRFELVDQELDAAAVLLVVVFVASLLSASAVFFRLWAGEDDADWKRGNIIF